MQRDYDKEPIIIKDYYANEIYKYMFYSCVPTLIIVAFISPFFETEAYNYGRGIGGLIVIIIFFLHKLNEPKKKLFFKFTNSNISYIDKNKQIKNLEKDDISRLILSFDRRHNYKDKAPKWTIIYTIIFTVIWASLVVFVYNIWLLIFAISFISFILFGAKPLLHIHKDGFKSLRIFDQLVIYENEFKSGKIINILIATNGEYNDLRDYFLQILNIDIDKIPRTFSIFKI